MAKSANTTLFYVDKFDEGLRTDVTADKAPQGSLVTADNVRYVPGGGFYMRRGIEEITAWAPATSYKIEQFGKCMEHDVLFVKTGTKIFQTNDEANPLYSIGWVGTSGYRGKFREYNSEMKYSNGQDIYLSITVGRVLTQFTNASTSIVMYPGNTDQFRTPKTNTFTVNATTDVFTAAAAHSLSNGDRIAFTNSGGALPTGLSTVTEYFVKNVTSTTFQVSATPGGSAVDMSDTGSGTHTFTDGILYCKGNLITYTKKKSSTFTAVAANDTITATAHGLENGSIVQLTTTTTLPGGLSLATNYYVIDRTTDTFKLSATEGGAAIDITDAGTGTHTYNASKGGDTFTGCTVPSGTYAVGSIVTQTKDVPRAPKASVIESVFEKIVAAGTPYAGHAMHYTVTANIDTPHNIDDFVSSGADSELFGKYGTVTAMETLLTKMYVAKDLGIEAWTGIDADGIPIREPFTNAYGVVNHDCLIIVGDKLGMFTTTRRQKTIEPDTTGANPQPVINPFFDQKITGTLRTLDVSQTNARMGYNEQDQLMRTTVEKDDLLKTIIYNTQTKGFAVDTGYSPSCWIEWHGKMYMGDASDDVIWKAESGYTDGSSSPALLAVTPVHFIGDRRRKTHIEQLFLTGLIKKKTEATVEIWCDGVLHRTVTLEGDASYVNETVFRPLGLDSIGYSPIGHSGGKPGVNDGFEFAVPIDINFECRYVQVKFMCQGTGYGVQIDSYEGVAGESSSPIATQIEAI